MSNVFRKPTDNHNIVMNDIVHNIIYDMYTHTAQSVLIDIMLKCVNQ